MITMAIAIFGDRHETPVFPRWLGYLSLWMAFIFIPGELIFFYDGPFAWNGLFLFWMAGVVFGMWGAGLARLEAD